MKKNYIFPNLRPIRNIKTKLFKISQTFEKKYYEKLYTSSFNIHYLITELKTDFVDFTNLFLSLKN